MAEGKLYNLTNIMESWGKTIVDELKEEVSKDKTMATRKLFQSIAPKIHITFNKFTLEINMEDYWRQVDEGQKSGTKPDVNKILKWMRHKKIQPKPAKVNLTKPYSKRARKVFKDRRLVLAEKIANAIQRKGTIKRFGYKGSGFVTEYLETLEQRMTKSIEEATGKDIEIKILN